MAAVDQAGEAVEVPHVRAFVLPMLWDVGLPTAAYYVARLSAGAPHMALLVATVAAGARVCFVAARSRRLDSIAAFLLAVFGIGFALSFVTGDARFLLAKDSIPTATAGLIFLGSCTIGSPLAYAWGRRIVARTPAVRQRWSVLWSTQSGFRRFFHVVSLAWGFGLLLEACVRLSLIYSIPIDAMAGLSSALSLGTVCLLAVWTVWYAHRVQR